MRLRRLPPLFLTLYVRRAVCVRARARVLDFCLSVCVMYASVSVHACSRVRASNAASSRLTPPPAAAVSALSHVMTSDLTEQVTLEDHVTCQQRARGRLMCWSKLCPVSTDTSTLGTQRRTRARAHSRACARAHTHTPVGGWTGTEPVEAARVD